MGTQLHKCDWSKDTVQRGDWTERVWSNVISLRERPARSFFSNYSWPLCVSFFPFWERGRRLPKWGVMMSCQTGVSKNFRKANWKTERWWQITEIPVSVACLGEKKGAGGERAGEGQRASAFRRLKHPNITAKCSLSPFSLWCCSEAASGSKDRKPDPLTLLSCSFRK